MRPMSRAKILGSEYSIKELFSDSFEFKIPDFQRPYSWDKEKAEALFTDLFAATENPGEVKDLDPYFLGCIILIKEDEKSESFIIDGQQRLVTLTILLSALRASLSKKDQNSLKSLEKYIYQEEDKFAGNLERYRITLRDRDQDFFKEFIQLENGIEKLKNQRDDGLTEVQKLIRDNALLFLEKLQGREISYFDDLVFPDSPMPTELQSRLAEFIIQKCYLVVVSTPGLETAYRIFSIINDRGFNLSIADILKAEVIGKIKNRDEHSRYARKWEEIEERIGREAFIELFSHIRTIFVKTKPSKNILDEIKKYILANIESERFINSFLYPYASAFEKIKGRIRHENIPKEVHDSFYWLNKIDNFDWLPPAIYYLSDNNRDKESLVLFFRKLERLAAGLMILRENASFRSSRYNKLLARIEQNYNLFEADSPLELTSKEQHSILTILDGNIYLAKRGICLYVLLRLESILSSVNAIYQDEHISIEHVLPQNPSNSEWVTLFPDQEERKQRYLHKLGNLTLLSGSNNRDAQNLEFALKKKKYVSPENGVPSFALTSQVIAKDKWTPKEIETRQKELLSLLKKEWQLYSQSDGQVNLFDLLKGK